MNIHDRAVLPHGHGHPRFTFFSFAYTHSMGTLIASLNVTLDGCCDHTQVIADEELHEYATDMVGTVDAVLFGRVTYELFADYWPQLAKSGDGKKAMVDYARAIDAVQKVVFSRTLKEVTWDHTRLVATDLAEEVKRLKAEGKKLVTGGSPSLVRQLMEAGLADELQILLQPIVAGGGKRFLEGLRTKPTLHLERTSQFGSGVMLLCYRIAS